MRLRNDSIEVVVKVTVLHGDDPRRIALAMVEDALASRPRKWHSQTFVSQSDVFVRMPALPGQEKP